MRKHDGEHSLRGKTWRQAYATALDRRRDDVCGNKLRNNRLISISSVASHNTLLPELYLHKLSTGAFDLALRDLVGDGAPLSASSIERLKTWFELDYEAWKTQDLSDLRIVYWWADGLYMKAGVEDRKRALLTIVGALSTGEKIVLACESGERESQESWLTLLRDLKHRGLTFP
jgi:transposase-like protein